MAMHMYLNIRPTYMSEIRIADARSLSYAPNVLLRFCIGRLYRPIDYIVRLVFSP